MSELPDRLVVALRGRYAIEGEVGAGGMATVYLAKDLKHDRKVAIKVLKPELAAVIGAERFLAEIKTTANLQHPHILPLFDSGEADGFLYYVMPFAEGESLRDKLDRERELPVDEAVRIARDAADALNYAHRQGVIHRDIKPENVLLHDGRTQIADFGIALAVSAASGRRLTETGLSLGTPAYMSPEQASGDREVDGRTDIYALGCLLYEMLAGQPPYTGSSAQAILAKVLTADPEPLTAHRPGVPWGVDAAIRAATARLPADRPRTAADFAEMLDSDPPPPGSPPTSRRAWVLGSALLALAAFATGNLTSRKEEAPNAAPSRRQVTFLGSMQHPSLSPDGTQLVFPDYRCRAEGQCRAELMLQDFQAGGNPVPIEPFADPASFIRMDWYWSVEWSPSGDRLVMTRARPDTLLTGVYIMPSFGGAATMLRRDVATSAVFRPDGRTVDWISWPEGFVEGTSMWRTLDLDTDSITDRRTGLPGTYLSWSPKGRWLAMIGRPWSGTGSRSVLTLLSPEGQVADTVSSPQGGTAWPRVRWNAEGDALYFMARGELYRISIDPGTGTFAGPARTLASGLEHPGWLNGDFTISADGRRLAWVDPKQRTSILTGEEGAEELWTRSLKLGTAWADFPALSYDGTRIAYIREDPVGINLYVQPFDGGIETPLTVSSGFKSHIEWSPDGQYLAFLEEDGGEDWLSIASTDVAGSRRLAVSGSWAYQHRFGWYPDSRHLVFASKDEMVTRVGVDEPPEPLFPLPDSVGILWDLMVSADGDSVATFSHRFVRGGSRLLIYVASIESGNWDLRFDERMETLDRALQPFDSPGLAGWRSQSPLHWMPDGSFLLAISATIGSSAGGTLWSIDRGGVPRVGRDLGACGSPTIVSASRDGSRFACVRREVLGDVWLMEDFDPASRGR